MAKIKYSALVTGMSGKLGGSILVFSQFGNYLKQNAWSQQHPTEEQSKQRTEIYRITKIWSSLTNTQKTSFGLQVEDYVRTNNLGQSVYLNRYQLFLWLNAGRRILNSSILMSAAPYESLTMPDAVLANVGSASIYMAFSNASANLKAVLYAAPPQPEGTTPKLEVFKKQHISTLPTGTSAFGINYSSMYDYTAPGIGEYFWCYFRIINSNTGATAGLTPILSKDRT